MKQTRSLPSRTQWWIATFSTSSIWLNAKKLPTMLYDPGAVAKGGLATYSADYNEIGRQSAKYIHRILEGANPADFAVEGADKLSLVINLKTAKQIGIAIPETVLARADRIIE